MTTPATNQVDQQSASRTSWARRRAMPLTALTVLVAFITGIFVGTTPVPSKTPYGTVAVYLAPNTPVDKPNADSVANTVVTYHEKVDNTGALKEIGPATATYRGDATVNTFCVIFDNYDSGDSTFWGPHHNAINNDCSAAINGLVSNDPADCEQQILQMAHDTTLDLSTVSFDFVTTRALDTACHDPGLTQAINGGGADVPVFTVSQGK